MLFDTKYYKETFQSYYDNESIHSANLYQLFAYLKNLEAKNEQDALAEGILLYPVIKKDVRLEYTMHGHKVRINTVNLAQDWKSIKQELTELVA